MNNFSSCSVWSVEESEPNKIKAREGTVGEEGRSDWVRTGSAQILSHEPDHRNGKELHRLRRKEEHFRQENHHRQGPERFCGVGNENRDPIINETYGAWDSGQRGSWETRL